MDTYVDPWEKAAMEAADLAMQLMRYGHWLRHQQAAFELAGITTPPELRAVALLDLHDARKVACAAEIMGVALDETSPMLSASTSFGELSVEAYAARWAVA